MKINAERAEYAFQPESVAVVTGGGQGIGRAIAEILAEQGLYVAICDINPRTASEVVTHIVHNGGKAVAFEIDITNDSSVKEAWMGIGRLGVCRYLVNNAGVPASSPLTMAQGLDGTIGGVVRMTDAWLSIAGENASSLVNISSIAGNDIGGGYINSFYPVGKAAISAYSRHIAVRFGGRPRANTVAPGLTLTPRIAPGLSARGAVSDEWTQRGPMKRLGLPHEVAEAVSFVLSDRASFVNGAYIRVDGGFVLRD